VYIPWQIQQDLSRARLEDTSRAARYAYRNADPHRRPLRRIAAILRWLSEHLGHAVPVRSTDRRRPAVEFPTADVDRSDLRLIVVAIGHPA
jgi:hypothetical protein